MSDRRDVLAFLLLALTVATGLLAFNEWSKRQGVSPPRAGLTVRFQSRGGVWSPVMVLTGRDARCLRAFWHTSPRPTLQTSAGPLDLELYRRYQTLNIPPEQWDAQLCPNTPQTPGSRP